jgi:hypothetical protein
MYDTFTVSKDSNLDVCSNGYGLCMSSKILNDGKLSNNLDEHMHKHLLPKYNWYIINIFTKIYSHKTNNFIGTNNLEVNRNHSNSITYSSSEDEEEEEEVQILSVSHNYKKRRLNIWKEIYSC